MVLPKDSYWNLVSVPITAQTDSSMQLANPNYACRCKYKLYWVWQLWQNQPCRYCHEKEANVHILNTIFGIVIADPFQIKLTASTYTLHKQCGCSMYSIHMHTLLRLTTVLVCARAWTRSIQLHVPHAVRIPRTALTHTITDATEYDQLDRAILRLWQLDQILDAPRLSAQERLAGQISIDNHYRDSYEWFSVYIPLNPNISEIGESRK